MSGLAATDYWDALTEDERWLGFGYLGGRAHEDGDAVAEADALLVEHMADWTDDERFAWANSKLGRWTADTIFGRYRSTSVSDAFAQARRQGLLVKVDPDA